MGCKITKTTDKDSYNPQGGSGISSTISSSPSFSNIKDNNQTTSSSFVYSKDLNTKLRKLGILPVVINMLLLPPFIMH